MTEQELSLESLRGEVQSLRREVSDLSQAIKALLEAWNTARGLVKFVKLIGTLAGGIAAIWALMRIGK
jgi:hypothetical protein